MFAYLLLIVDLSGSVGFGDTRFLARYRFRSFSLRDTFHERILESIIFSLIDRYGSRHSCFGSVEGWCNCWLLARILSVMWIWYTWTADALDALVNLIQFIARLFVETSGYWLLLIWYIRFFCIWILSKCGYDIKQFLIFFDMKSYGTLNLIKLFNDKCYKFIFLWIVNCYLTFYQQIMIKLLN